MVYPKKECEVLGKAFVAAVEVEDMNLVSVDLASSSVRRSQVLVHLCHPLSL